MSNSVRGGARVAWRAVMATAVMSSALVMIAPITADAARPPAPSKPSQSLGRAGAATTTDQVGANNAVVQYGNQVHVFTEDTTSETLRHEWWDGARWNSETLDGSGSTWPGHTTDLVGGSTAAVVFDGQLHVFINDVATGSVRHDWWDGTRWNFETLDGPGGGAGSTTDPVGGSIAVTIFNGQLHVFSQDDATLALRHEWWDGSRWHLETLDGAGSLWPGATTDRIGAYLAVAAFGPQLQVFVYDATMTALRHEWWDGIRWNFETLDGPGASWAGHTSDPVGAFNVVVLFDGQLHLFGYDLTASTLSHEWWDGTRWNFETLDGAGSSWAGHTSDTVGLYTAATVFDGQLHLVTEVGPSGTTSLGHDWWDGSRWHFEILDGPGSAWPGHGTDPAGNYTALTVLGSQLQVFTQSGASLRHDWWDGALWDFGTLDGPISS